MFVQILNEGKAPEALNVLVTILKTNINIKNKKNIISFKDYINMIIGLTLIYTFF